MNLWRQFSDFGRWLAEVGAALSPQDAPRHALGLVDGQPALMKREAGRYVMDRPAEAADKAPLFINEDNSLSAQFEVLGATSLLGIGPARIEAAKRCPFPLDQTRWALVRRSAPWTSGAPWLFAAAQSSRVSSTRDMIRTTGATPLAAFAMVGDTALYLDRARPRRITAAVTILAALSGIAAYASVTAGSAAIVGDGEERLAAAHAELTAAEQASETAAGLRDAAASPIRAAQAADALLTSAPSVAATLAALTAVMPDTAHARRLSLAPGVVEVEIRAPDAAALAAAIAAGPDFTAARLKTAARVEAQTGLQRATLAITAARPE